MLQDFKSFSDLFCKRVNEALSSKIASLIFFEKRSLTLVISCGSYEIFLKSYFSNPFLMTGSLARNTTT